MKNHIKPFNNYINYIHEDYNSDIYLKELSGLGKLISQVSKEGFCKKK